MFSKVIKQFFESFKEMTREQDMILRRKSAINQNVGLIKEQIDDLQEAWFLERQI
jgi:hypothetical protein